MREYSEKVKKADVLLRSSAVFTGKCEKPEAGSIAIFKNKIQEVIIGRDDSHVIDNNTVIKDYGDKLIMPGFVDAHVHFVDGSITSSKHVCNLTDSTGQAQAVEMLKNFYEANGNEKRIRAYGWFPATWNDEPLPTKESLDKAFPDIPVYCIAADFHTFWMNSAALEEAGFDKDYQPEAGVVGKDENGELNGLIFEPAAYKPAMCKFQEFSPEENEENIKNFIKKLASSGITAVGDMSAFDYVNESQQNIIAAKSLSDKGELTCRIHIYSKLADCEDFSQVNKLAEKYNDDRVKISGVKGFVDGVTSTFTGLLYEPYEDKPETCGIEVPIMPQEVMQRYVSAANKCGLSVRLHCVGDGAVHMALDMYEKSIQENGDMPDIRNTIEHIENIVPEDMKRFKELNVIPSMQPMHLIIDQDEKIRRMGKARCRWEWPHRSLLDSDAELALGTDYPVVDFDPFPTIHAAVARKNLDGSPAGVNPQEKITTAEAVSAYTAGAANAYGRADEFGTLEAGKFADIIVVDKNIFSIDEDEILNAEVVMTMMDGRIVFEK